MRLQQAGYDVVGISPDAPAKLARFVEQESLTYPLLSDPDKQVMDAYGAYGEKSLYGKKVTGVIRSTVVVGPDGTVELAKYNVKATGHVASLSKALGWLHPPALAPGGGIAARPAPAAWPGVRPRAAPYDRGCAEVVKLADTQDLGSCAFGREGSSPFFRTHAMSRDTVDRCLGTSLHRGPPRGSVASSSPRSRPGPGGWPAASLDRGCGRCGLAAVGGLGAGLVVAVGVQDQLAEQFAGLGVDDADVQLGRSGPGRVCRHGPRPRPMWCSRLLWRRVITPLGSMRSWRMR